MDGFILCNSGSRSHVFNNHGGDKDSFNLKMKGNKRGSIEREELVRWILWFFIAAALIFVTSSITLYVIQQSDVEKCRLSVVTRGKAQLAGKPLPISLACYTRDIEIKEDGAYLNKKLLRKFEGSLETEMKKTIAEEMYTCWYQFAEGEYNPFGGWWWSAGSRCVVCSNIEFDENIQGKQIKEFTKFLDETKIPTTDITYSSYLFRNSEGKKIEGQALATDKEYAVTFVMLKKEKLDSWLGLAITALPPAVQPAAANLRFASWAYTQKDETVPMMMFTELDAVANNCDRLY